MAMVTRQEAMAAGTISAALAKLEAAIAGLGNVIDDVDWAIGSVVLVNPHAAAITVGPGEVDRDTLVLMAETLKGSYEQQRDALLAQLEAI